MQVYSQRKNKKLYSIHRNGSFAYEMLTKMLWESSTEKRYNQDKHDEGIIFSATLLYRSNGSQQLV